MQIVYRYDPCSSIRGITKHLACFELVVAAPLKVKPVVTFLCIYTPFIHRCSRISDYSFDWLINTSRYAARVCQRLPNAIRDINAASHDRCDSWLDEPRGNSSGKLVSGKLIRSLSPPSKLIARVFPIDGPPSRIIRETCTCAGFNTARLFAVVSNAPY